MLNKDYRYPTLREIERYSAIGINAIRLPFLWERLQPQLNAPFNDIELKHLDFIVSTAGMHSVTIILDPHDFGKYRGQIIGSASVPTEAFLNFWQQLATHYRNEKFVAFGLMNEPYLQDAQEWAAIAQKAINAIRRTGARQLILVPGTMYSGAHSWKNKASALSNAEALASLNDPAHHYAIEVHQYFDADASGTHPECVSYTVGEDALSGVTEWLKATHQRGFLGEFGAADNDICLKALHNMLHHMQMNPQQWLGWTYWAASPWMKGYMFNIDPPDPALHKQLKEIEEFLPHR